MTCAVFQHEKKNIYIYIYIDCCNGIAISHIIVHAKTPSGIGMSKGWTAAGLSGASKCGEVQMTCALTIQIKIYIYIYIYCWLFTITIYIYIMRYTALRICKSFAAPLVLCITSCALQGQMTCALKRCQKKRVCIHIYTYMLGASAGIYTCFDPLTQRTRVACSWDLRVCVSSFAQTHLYIYTLVYCLALKQFQALESKQI